MKLHFWRVVVRGFFGDHQREFEDYGDAIAWVRKIGKERDAKISMIRRW